MRDYILITYKVRALLLMMLLAVVLGSCSDDSDKVGGESDLLQLVPYTSEMVDFTPSTTRAVTLPTGYTEYTGPNSIGVYTTTASEAPDKVRTFSYVNSAWNSQVSVTNTMQYYIYGYMPVNDNTTCTISKRSENEDYSTGAVLNFTNLPPVMAEDFSVITGVQQVSSANPSANPEESVSLTAGNFSYVGRASGSNFVCLMLDHLYSCIRFNFKVDDTYSNLRTIKLKEVKLKTVYSFTYPLTVTMKTGEAYTVTWGNGTSSTPDFITLFAPENGSEVKLPSVSDTDVDHAVKVDGYFAPLSDVANNLVLECKYDVYDKNMTTEHPDGNLVRANCVATNKLPASSLDAGVNLRTSLTLTVSPTYLYVLSDPDLDNPTVVISL